ncbi:unnamed protein product [Leptosia nina]|uniref:Uncharacterized protein n=1 Tax=Leptosia nina TaxID=320188 RepID=A0AAV1JAT9_9NEOP
MTFDLTENRLKASSIGDSIENLDSALTITKVRKTPQIHSRDQLSRRPPLSAGTPPPPAPSRRRSDIPLPG